MQRTLYTTQTAKCHSSAALLCRHCVQQRLQLRTLFIEHFTLFLYYRVVNN